MTRHRLLAVAFSAMAWLPSSFSQQTSQPPPPKPYRERLLDRARKGDADAQFELGKNYETGRIGLPRDLTQAQFWYKKAADQGDPYSEASLAILFNFGKGVPRDNVQAYMWYQRAITHSDGSNRDSIVEMRDNLAEQMTPEQIAEAQRLIKAQRLTKEQKPAEGSKK